MENFELDDLPKYSERLKDLLNDSLSKKEKNEKQINREFGQDKWGALLAKWIESPCNISDVRDAMTRATLVHSGIVERNLKLMTEKEAHYYYVNLVESALLEDSSKTLVEIGCGFGSVLLDLVGRGNLNYNHVYGLEYTDQGVELAERLSRWHNYDVQMAKGDFNLQGISNITIPPESDILTSYSFHYVKDSSKALNNLITLNPRRVIHFEPMLQHYDQSTLLGCLQAKYLLSNGYNTTMRNDLRLLEESGKVEVLQDKPMVFGSNCLLPASLVIWRPLD